MDKPKLILLDVYETLLDMSEVERKVNIMLDSKRGYLLWFELFMEYCFVDNCTSQFNDFAAISKATLQMAGKMFNISVGDHDCEHVLELLKQLPVKEGVQKGLSALRDRDIKIAALTNAPEETVRVRMDSTGLISYFEKVLSAEHVKKYKPCCEVYDWAAKQLDVNHKDVMVISAHGWDIAGAANAGMQTAYIRQSKQILYPLAPVPLITGKNLLEIADQLNF